LAQFNTKPKPSAQVLRSFIPPLITSVHSETVGQKNSSGKKAKAFTGDVHNRVWVWGEKALLFFLSSQH